MIKLSDYIVKKLEGYGVKNVFMISGGGAMHLNDSFGKSKKIQYICNHNEQASAISAEGFARLNQDLAVVCVTTGPGGINCLNGVFGQWTDSVPVLYISGQVKQATTIKSCPHLNLRQLGDQEADIISIVKPITKYAVSVDDPYKIDAILTEAVNTALSGRKGPVWIDVPINIQAALIDEQKLAKPTIAQRPAPLPYKEIKAAINLLGNAKRPLIVAGHGVRLAKAQHGFEQLLNTLNIPVVTTFNGFDVLPDDNPFYVGRIGTVGQRAGNFALQSADVILFLGTRNNIRQISYNWENYAPRAKKIIVDVDGEELKKPTVKADVAVNADLKDFIAEFLKYAKPLPAQDWLDWCIARKQKYTPLSEFKIKPAAKVHPYLFTQTLTSLLKTETVVATNATACVTLFQAGVSHKGQRMFLNSGDASMGYGLPAAIGACVAGGQKPTICLEGDGSIMMNLQELQTIKHYNLPIKIFVLNNKGYISIIQTQNNFFEGRLTACSPKSGVTVPDFAKVAKAFGLKTAKITSNKNLKANIKKLLAQKGPLLCDVLLQEDYIFTPKLSSKKLPDGTMISAPLEDMYPFLDKKELEQNIIR